MAKRAIVKLPDPKLREKSLPVSSFNSELSALVQDMADTMSAAKGIGLAAVQIGVLSRVVILDLGENGDRLEEGSNSREREQESEDSQDLDTRPASAKRLEVYINPKIVSAKGSVEYEEGCLSIPGIYGKVKRKEELEVEFQDIHGAVHRTHTRGLRSIALQHEIDHCDGILFTDHVGPMQRMMLLAKYNKQRAQE